jgi:hypothetical protein
MLLSISNLRTAFLVIGTAACMASGCWAQSPKKREMPADFKSDGCTFFPDGNYYACCLEHDKAYYFGGSLKERRAADDELYACVADKVGPKRKFTAQIMWLGVRVGGLSFLPTKFRWGFGNKYPRMSPEKPPNAELK